MPERLSRWENLRSEKERSFLWRLHAKLPARDSLSAFLAAAIICISGVALKPLADSWIGQTLPPFLFSYPTVVIVALIAGARIGSTVAVVSIAVAWVVFLPPSWSFRLSTEADAVALLIYSSTSIVLALVIGFARYTLDLAVASEAMRDYDAREAVPRVKNVLAVVQALAWGTLRDSEDLEDLRGSLFPRLSALATAQDVLLNIPQGSTMVRNLVTAAVRPFLPDPRITVHCKEDVAVPASYAHGLTLALFELATNSAKYGALSASTGSIVISCERRDEEVVLQWVETSPKVGPNQSASLASESFGRKLIKAALRNDRGTDVSYECSAGSVMANFRWPSHVAH